MAIALIVSIISLSIYLAYKFSKRKFNYWKKINVPYLEPTPVLGNFGEYILQKKYVGHVYQKICQQFPNVSSFGVFYGTEPTIVIQDPELIKLITTKDFYYFSSREVSKYTHNEIFTQNLFFTYGDRWKVIRQNLTPLFSSAKMKRMFHLIEKCSFQFEDLLDDITQISNVTEIRSLITRFTMDCIGACAFGVDTNAMGKDLESNPFRIIGDIIFEVSNWRGFKLIARVIWPAVFYGVRLKVFPDKLYSFFHKLLTGVFKERQYKPSARNDFVDLVLKFKKNNFITGDSLSNLKSSNGKKISLKVDDELLLAQCLVFFAAGFETSATTLSFTLYELAKNEDTQIRALEEVDAYLRRHEGKLDYECVIELPYLEACIDEALRLYPVLAVLSREVVEDYTLPSGVVLEEGLRVHLPIYHLHHHPEHFPEPEQFRPERFLGEEKKNIKPYTYMPFGEGPRICIGMRFAKMQILAGLVTILKKYRVELAEDQPRTLQFEPRAIVTQPIGGIRLKLLPRTGWEQRLFRRQEEVEIKAN